MYVGGCLWVMEIISWLRIYYIICRLPRTTPTKLQFGQDVSNSSHRGDTREAINRRYLHFCKRIVLDFFTGEDVDGNRIIEVK